MNTLKQRYTNLRITLPDRVNSFSANMVKVAIIYYSMYGHVGTLAQAEKKGIEAAGGQVDIYQYVYRTQKLYSSI